MLGINASVYIVLEELFCVVKYIPEVPQKILYLERRGCVQLIPRYLATIRVGHMDLCFFLLNLCNLTSSDCFITDWSFSRLYFSKLDSCTGRLTVASICMQFGLWWVFAWLLPCSHVCTGRKLLSFDQSIASSSNRRFLYCAEGPWGFCPWLEALTFMWSVIRCVANVEHPPPEMHEN